jgi:predicted alpha/beta superfamily hydrolase
LKQALISYVFILSISNVIAQSEPVAVAFQVIAPRGDDTSAVYISGNHELLGNWAPNHTLLENPEKGIWSLTLHFARGTQLQYKYTKGSWSQEAMYQAGIIPGNSTLKVNNDTTVIVEIMKWRDDLKPGIKGQITGTVNYHRNVKTAGIRARDIIVWFPPGYGENLQQRFPVLYMHDGQNLMDPKTAAFGVDWRIDEVADSLIRTGKIEPLIIVGIYNTADRSQEYNDTDLGRVYMKFVIETVKPLIDSTYRTRAGREYTATGGSSAGGLISFMLLWEHSDIFSKAACLSPAFKIEEIDYIPKILMYQGARKDIRIYIDNGGVNIEKKLQPGIDDMLHAIRSLGYKSEADYYWFKDPRAAHNEAAWSRRISRPLKIFYSIE